MTLLHQAPSTHDAQLIEHHTPILHLRVPIELIIRVILRQLRLPGPSTAGDGHILFLEPLQRHAPRILLRPDLRAETRVRRITVKPSLCQV